MGHPPPKWMVNLGSDAPAINEYLNHPDHRQYATFFLGWLFFLSQVLFLTSPTLRSIVLRLKRTFNSLNGETRSNGVSAEKSTPTITSSDKSDALSLVFLLNLLILTTSATQFASLLAFDSSNGETSCVFLTAWNGLGVQAVRLAGFLKLGLHLKELGARKWESWVLWGLLLFSAVLMFLTNAVSTGTLQPIPSTEEMFSFCYRRHYAFTGGLTSAVNFFVELYIIVRFITLQLPFFLIRRDRQVFADLRLLRALSLLLLDALTVYPSIRFVSIAADYIPSALGMIPVLLAFNHQLPRGYSLSSSSGRSTKSTNLAQPPTSFASSVRSLDHILPMHTPPSTFEVRSSEYGHSGASSHGRPQPHPFGATALDSQSVMSGYPYLLPTRRGAMSAARPDSPAVHLWSPLVDSKSPTVDTIPGQPSNVDPAGSIKTSTIRQSFLPALPTMAWGTDVKTPLNVEPVQPSPVGAGAPTSALAPRTRLILPNQAEVAAGLPKREPLGFIRALGLWGRGASTSGADTLPVPPGPLWQPRIAVSRQLISPVLEEDDTSKDPDKDAPTMPSSPRSIVYGSDILSPSGELVNVMKQSRSTRSKHVSYATTGHRTSTASWVGAWSVRHSTTESMAVNYPFLAPPLSPGLTASSGTGSGSRRPSDASRRSEGGGKRPNTFGKESFLDFKVLFTGSRASSTKTNGSHSTDELSRSHSGTDESAGTGTSKREKGKAPRKARRTPVGAGVSNKEQPQANVDPAPPQETTPEDPAI